MKPRAQTSSKWQDISEELQILLAQKAMRQAALIIADQAELFAVQFKSGTLQDRGSADGLQLFAAVLRETTSDTLAPMGTA